LDECCEHKKNPGTFFMCEFAVTLELYRATNSLFYAESHFFPKQKNYFSRSSINGCITAQEYINMNIRLLQEK
jgi:hypothetical protein